MPLHLKGVSAEVAFNWGKLASVPPACSSHTQMAPSCTTGGERNNGVKLVLPASSFPHTLLPLYRLAGCERRSGVELAGPGRCAASLTGPHAAPHHHTPYSSTGSGGGQARPDCSRRYISAGGLDYCRVPGSCGKGASSAVGGWREGEVSAGLGGPEAEDHAGE